MNLRDQLISRCIYAACARPMPRRVKFCPYCGTGQEDSLARPVPAARLPEPAPPGPPAPPASAVAVARKEPSAMPPLSKVQRPPAPPQKPASAPSQAAEPRPAKLRYWIIVLAALWMVWLYGRPSPGKIEAQVDHALALSAQCNIGAATRELVALRASEAREGQIKQVQAAIDAAALTCEKERVQSARGLLNDAERALALGNYKAAADKMEVCLAMLDADNRKCIALKARADKLHTQMQRCLATKHDWNRGRCL